VKSRIFIAMHYMEIGGAESSLIGLLEALDPGKVDVDLFVFSHQGVFMNAIPAYVNLLPEIASYSMMEKPMIEVLKKGYLNVVLARLFAKIKCNRYVRKHPTDLEQQAIFGYVGKEMSKVVPHLYKYGEYDLAISYLQPHNFVLEHVKAKKKIAWIHTDYSKIELNTKLELSVWDGYDRIVSISSDVTKGFLSKFPTLSSKILEMENILPKSYIEARANKKVLVANYNEDGVLTLCSVGRISYAKNYDNIPYIAAELKRLFKDNAKPLISNLSTLNSFKWYIVGPGDHSDIDKLSKELGVDNNVIFLGPSDNPYPFIKNCDIYVHPSRFEGKSVVVREAQMLCKPVIITDYPTAKSQVNDGVDGVICNMDNKKVAWAIMNLVCDREKQQEIACNLSMCDYAGEREVYKIYDLLKA